MRELAALAALFSAAGAASAQDSREADPRPTLQEPVRRAPADTSRDFVRLAFNFYDQRDGGGNPRLGEEMTVLEPQLLLSKTLSPQWTATLKCQADLISAASVEAKKRFPPGAQSGASGDKYLGLDVGAFYAWSDQTTIGAGVSYATEYDYSSVGGYLKWTHDTADRNNTFVAKASAYFDSLDLILFDGKEDGTDSRHSVAFGLGWTRVLGPETVASFSWDLTSQSGFLSTPYNSVFAGGTEVRELLPDTRLRNSFFARVRHLVLPDVAIEPGAGFYFDDWGARAWHAELQVHWEAIPEVLIVRPAYRYHQQTAVDFFVTDPAGPVPTFRTQDSDLADFTSHTVGLKLIFPHARILGDNQEIEIGAEYTLRSDHLDAFSVTFGYQWRF